MQKESRQEAPEKDRSLQSNAGYKECVLVIDDEQDVLDSVEDLLDMCKLDTATTFEQAENLLLENAYDIAILDIMGVDGYGLLEIANPNLWVQVSLDGGRAEHHDAYRGAGSWKKTIEGICTLQDNDFNLRLSSTETPANSAHLDKLREFRRSLGIADEDHFVRPLARRGFSSEGLEVGPGTLVPEITATINGIYWHPLASPSSEDMLVTQQLFPLSAAVNCIQKNLEAQPDGVQELLEFT